jgi:hypothetical protein
MLNDAGVLSDDEMGKHLKGLIPNNILHIESEGYVLFYVLSNHDETIVVLSCGESINHEKLNGEALKELFKFN